MVEGCQGFSNNPVYILGLPLAHWVQHRSTSNLRSPDYDDRLEQVRINKKSLNFLRGVFLIVVHKKVINSFQS